MSETQQIEKQTNNQKKAVRSVITVLIIINIFSIAVGLFAWSKYQEGISENVNTPIAKWNFDLKLKNGPKNGEAEETQGPIDLADTIDFTHVKSGTIAPGTNGEFQVIVNTEGTETDVLYEVTISLTNCPRNITFSRVNENNVTTVLSAGGASNTTSRTLSFSQYLHVKPTNENGRHVETIRWNWPYEADVNETAANKTAWDTRDGADNGLQAEMTITAKGTEMLEESQTSPSISVNVGDTILYNPSGTYSWNIELAQAYGTGTNVLNSGTGNTFNIDTWKVLSVDSNGNIEMVPLSAKGNLVLQGAQGYNNGVKLLNDACSSLYGGSQGSGITARSICEQDFIKAGKKSQPNDTDESNDWTRYRAAFSNGYATYGYQKQNVFSQEYSHYPSIYALEKNSVIDGTTATTGLDSDKQTTAIEKNDYSATNGLLQATSIQPYQSYYEVSNYSSTSDLLDSSKASILLPNNGSISYWIANRAICLYESGCSYFLRCIYSGRLSANSLSGSGSYSVDTSMTGLFPVVSLNASVLQTTETENVYEVQQQYY